MKILKVFSKILIILGFFITLIASLIAFYGVFSAVHGIQNSAESGIGIIVTGMGRAYFWDFVDLFGLAVLAFGLLLALIASITKKAK